MNTQRTRLTPLLVVAGAVSFLFAALPFTLGLDTNRDRATAEAPILEKRTDLSTADQIRAMIAADPTLSTDAKNVKVVTNSGNVFLRGTVASPEEKAKLVGIAKQVSKAALIDNDLDVRAPEGTPDRR